MSKIKQSLQPKTEAGNGPSNPPQRRIRRIAPRVLSRNPSKILSIAVVGAGMAGAMAARTLADKGYRVCLFDKARGVGGRMAWRREDDYEFDHGAQYFSARDPSFKDYVQSWLKIGLVDLWQPSLANVKNGVLSPKTASSSFYVGTPGMNTVIKHLVSDLNVALGTPVISIDKNHDKGQWQVITETGINRETYDGVVIAIPPMQATTLLNATAPSLIQTAKNVQLAPCWAVMLVFDETLPVTFDGLFFQTPRLLGRHVTPVNRSDQNLRAGFSMEQPTGLAVILKTIRLLSSKNCLQRFFRALV